MDHEHARQHLSPNRPTVHPSPHPFPSPHPSPLAAGCHGTRYVRYHRGWHAYPVRTVRGALGASRPAPLARTVRGRLIRVACTYPTEAPGRACQLRVSTRMGTSMLAALPSSSRRCERPRRAALQLVRVRNRVSRAACTVSGGTAAAAPNQRAARRAPPWTSAATTAERRRGAVERDGRRPHQQRARERGDGGEHDEIGVSPIEGSATQRTPKSLWASVS